MLTAELKPDPGKALAVVEQAISNCWSHDTSKADLIVAIARAAGFLRGYRLEPGVLRRYCCSFCGMDGVKLWEAWCCNVAPLRRVFLT